MDFSLIKSETKDRICYITLARPEKKNALNDALVTELKTAFHAAENDAATKVIILKAEGDVFSAGADLDYLQQLQKNTFKENLQDSNHLKELFLLIHTLKKIVIAQVEGHAIAGGCGLAAVCDFGFAVPEAKFGYTEVKIGFIPALVTVFLLHKISGARAKELLLSGKLITAGEAARYGIISEVFPRQAIASQVRQFAERLCEETSSQSIAATKEMISKIPSMELTEALDYAAKMNATARGTEDCKKGIDSFLKKEKLVW